MGRSGYDGCDQKKTRPSTKKDYHCHGRFSLDNLDPSNPHRRCRREDHYRLDHLLQGRFDLT